MDINLEIVLKIICANYGHFYWLKYYDWALFVSCVGLASILIYFELLLCLFLAELKLLLITYLYDVFSGLFVICVDLLFGKSLDEMNEILSL